MTFPAHILFQSTSHEFYSFERFDLYWNHLARFPTLLVFQCHKIISVAVPLDSIIDNKKNYKKHEVYIHKNVSKIESENVCEIESVNK